MAILPINTAAIQAAQVSPGAWNATRTLPGAGSIGGANFDQALRAQMGNPAASALQTQGVGAANGTLPLRNVAIDMIRQTEQMQAKAQQSVHGVLKGGDNAALQNAVIAMEEASVSFQLLVEMRNKVVEGLQELMRMQI